MKQLNYTLCGNAEWGLISSWVYKTLGLQMQVKSKTIQVTKSCFELKVIK